MPACGYEFYLLVFNTISHKLGHVTSKSQKHLFCEMGTLF